MPPEDARAATSVPVTNRHEAIDGEATMMCAKRRLVVLAVVAALGGTMASAQGGAGGTPVKDRLVGTWTLVKWDVFDANGGPTRTGAYDVGRLTYDTVGQMSAHLMNSANRSSAAPASDAERAAAYRRYLGYFGPFTVDEARGVVVHHVIGSSNPTWPGSEQVRYYELSADGQRLSLSLKNGDRVTQTLYWERTK
jgi:Lipocalin-like domain